MPKRCRYNVGDSYLITCYDLIKKGETDMYNFSTMNNMINMVSQFKNNPTQMLAKKFNIPSELTNPNDIIQHLLNTNQVSKSQIDGFKEMANNPMFKQLFK